MPAESSKKITEPKRLHSIDALRGLAFLGVLLGHAGQAAPVFAESFSAAPRNKRDSALFVASPLTRSIAHHPVSPSARANAGITAHAA